MAEANPLNIADHELVLIWLDDNSEDDDAMKDIFLQLFDGVLTFTDHDECLRFVEMFEVNLKFGLSVLISGKYGQLLVRQHFQNSEQIKRVYVYCFDVAKHKIWSEQCNKVRCVTSNINKIFECMHHDIKHMKEKVEPQEDENDDDTEGTGKYDDGTEDVDKDNNETENEDEQVNDRKSENDNDEMNLEVNDSHERFTDDNNLYDQLALNLLFDSPDDGKEDFIEYCQGNNENHIENIDAYFKDEKSLEELLEPNSILTNMNSSDLNNIWKFRWFIRLFHRKVIKENEQFIVDREKFTVYYSTYLSIDEFNAIKHRIGQIVVFTEFLRTYSDERKALESMENINDKQKHKVIFEIRIDPTNHDTVPYAKVNDGLLLWFGSRCRISKVEYTEETEDNENTYLIIGVNLCSTLNKSLPIQNLYKYYSKELVHLDNLDKIFARIFLTKCIYSGTKVFLERGKHYLELTEIALRQCNYNEAQKYLENIPDDCEEANLLRSYLFILTSNQNLHKARYLLIKLMSETNDRILRARVNFVFGFIYLNLMQKYDHALEYFTVANETLRKYLPNIHPYIAMSYIGLGYTYYAQNRIMEARKSFEEAFMIQQQCLWYNHADLAKTRIGLAHCLSTDKKTIKQALQELEHAKNNLSNIYNQNHPQVLETKKDIENLQKGKTLKTKDLLLDYI